MFGRKLFRRNNSSVTSFGNKLQLESGGFDAAKPSTFNKASYNDDNNKTESTVKRRNRKRDCCRALVVFAILILLGITLFAAAVFSSRPGYDKRTQDANSAPTRAKIQSTRADIPAIVARLQAGGKQDLVDHIQRATAFSAAAYVNAQHCPNPVGTNLSRSLSARGYVARDETARQIVVAFKGFTEPRDIVNALDVAFDSLNVAGSIPPGARVHRGLQASYKAVESQMLDTVNSELARNNNYSILVTGHTTGGTHAVLAALAIKASFPNNLVLCVTQGQGRAFNQMGAEFVDQQFPPSSFQMIRAVHTLDGLPTAGAPYVNTEARHHSGEIWQFQDPALPENIVLCRGQEDPDCSMSNPSPVVQAFPPALPFDAETLHYFDVEMNSGASVECGGRGGLLFHNLITSRGPLKNRPSAETIARSLSGQSPLLLK